MRSKSKIDEFYATLPPSLLDLLSACGRAAVKTVNILDVLRHRYMLDIFLPFDLEYLSAAASVLIVLEDLLKFRKSDRLTKRLSLQLLDSLVKRGSVPARFRHEELTKISELSKKYWKQRLLVNKAQGLLSNGRRMIEQPDRSEALEATIDPDIQQPSDPLDEQYADSSLPNISLDTPDLGSDSFADMPFNEPLSEQMVQYFELAQDDILEIADRLDGASPLPEVLDFSEITEDWLWDVANNGS